jgi:hypothetical protein
MVVNLIVASVTLLMAGFIAVWAFFPHLRRWMEEPKYRFLEQQRRYPEDLRKSVQHPEERTPRQEPARRHGPPNRPIDGGLSFEQEDGEA